MSAINDNALSKFIGKLYVATATAPTNFTRIASVRWLIANYDNTAKQVEINADDTWTILKSTIPELSVVGEFLENFDRDLINKLLWGTIENVAWTIVNNFSQEVASGDWNYNKFIPLTNQNGDGSAITPDSVTAGTDGALVLDTDYFLTDVDGVKGIMIIDSTTVTTEAQTITIVYDYTPNASEKIILTQSAVESVNLVIKIEATDPDDETKKRIITLDTCVFDGTYGLSFLDVVEAGDLTGTSFNFKGNKNATLTIENQIL